MNMNSTVTGQESRTEVISTIQESMQMIFQKMLNMANLDMYDEMDAEERFEEIEDELIDSFISFAHMGDIESIISERLEEEFADILERA